jgi:transposase
MYSVGLDVGDNCSSIEILDPNGKSFKHLEVKGRWPVMLQRIEREVPRPFAVCFEASNGYGYLHEQLSKLSQRVAVAHPGQLRLIFRAKKKHNRVDAQKLAKLLYLDQVPAVHVPRGDVRSWRGTIEHRQRLLSRRVSVKNQIHALLKGQGIQKIEQVRSLWSKKGIAWLSGLELGGAGGVAS